MFAVIRSGGKQYRVNADDVIQIEKLQAEAGEFVEFGEVLMVGDGDKATIGAPHVAGAMVTGEVLEQLRGPKVISFKKRRRQNSKRTRGHRQALTRIRISEILTDGAKPTKKVSAKPTGKAAQEKTAAKAEPARKSGTDSVAKKAEPKSAQHSESASAPLFTAPEGKGDDLTKIKGIGPVARKQLNEQGITRFAQLAELSDSDIARIDEAMPFSAEQIADWRDQAKKLAK